MRSTPGVHLLFESRDTRIFNRGARLPWLGKVRCMCSDR